VSCWIGLERLGCTLVLGSIALVGLVGVALGLYEIIGEHSVADGLQSLLGGSLVLATCICLAKCSWTGRPVRPEWGLIAVAILGMYLVTYGFMLGIGVVSERSGPPERPGRRSRPEVFMVVGGALISAAFTDWAFRKRKP
jgi:hypothetical protein